MTEDEREELIYSLLDEFKASIGSISDQQKYAFIAGARSALVAEYEEWRPIERDRENIYHAIESNVRSEPDKHFIDRRYLVGVNDAVDAILALSDERST